MMQRSWAAVPLCAVALGLNCANSDTSPANDGDNDAGELSDAGDDLNRDGGGDGASSRVPTAAERATAKAEIEAFLATREQPNPPSATQLARTLEQQGFSGEDVEAMLRAGPESYPSEATNSYIGNIVLRSVDCYHVVYSSTYYLYVPATYAPSKPTPLVVIGHGGNSAMSRSYAESTALSYVTSYSDLADGSLGAILIAPATTVGWTPMGDSLIESTISTTIREFNVDPDRIYIAGQSMGGHLAWRSAMNHGDRFAAYSPESGGYASYIDDHLIENVFGTRGYVTYGTTEPYELDATNDLLGAWLTQRHYPWVIVKKSGGHSIYTDEIPNIGAFFAAKPRDLYPTRTYLHAVGELRYPDSTTPTGTGRYARILRWNFRNWIELEPRPDLSAGVTFHGEVKDRSRIEIVSEGVRSMNVLLHPKLVDMTKTITIAVNGAIAYQGVPALDLAQLLERVREFDDRGRIYYASIPLRLSTDRAVPTPTYP